MLRQRRARCVPSFTLAVAASLVLAGCAAGPTSPVGPTGSPQPPGPTASASPTSAASPTPEASPAPSTIPTAATALFSQWQQLAFPEPLPHVYGGSDVTGAAQFGGGYVAVGSVNGGCCDAAFSTDSHGVVWRSADGVAWLLESRAAVFDLAHLVGLASDGHRLVAIGVTFTDDAGEAGSHGAVWVSDEGLAWQRQAVVPTFVAVAATTSGFVAAANGSDGPELWTSPDGLRWANVATASTLGPGEVWAMAATAGGVVAVGSGSPADASTHVAAAWQSPDGAHWTRATAQPWFSNASMSAIAVSGSSIVAVGNDLGSGSAVWRSTDGLAWSRGLGSQLEVAGTSSLGIVAGQRGFIVVGSIEGNVPRRIAWRSADGIDWSELDTPLGPGIDVSCGISAGDALLVFTRSFVESLGRAVPQAWSVR